MKTFFLVLFLGVLLFTISPSTALAECAPTPAQTAAVTDNKGGAIIFTPEVPLPDFVGGPIDGQTIAKYIRAVFVYFIWTVGILATFMVVYGGMKWVSAAGNPGRINDARETINNAIIGVIIALTSVLLLNTISPNLTNFRGLTIRPVEPCLLVFLSDVTKATGVISPNVCGNVQNRVSGEPSQACTVSSCEAGYNIWINDAAKKYDLDAVLIKAVIEVETYSNNQGYPISQAAKVTASQGSQLLSSSYGLSQMICSTLVEQLSRVRSSALAACPTSCPRQANGSLATTCASYLDSNLKLQVELVASYLKTVSTGRCVKSNPTFIAAAYHLGPGGIEDYCQGKSLRDTTREAAVAYINEFNTQYYKICKNSPPVGLEPVN